MEKRVLLDKRDEEKDGMYEMTNHEMWRYWCNTLARFNESSLGHIFTANISTSAPTVQIVQEGWRRDICESLSQAVDRTLGTPRDTSPKKLKVRPTIIGNAFNSCHYHTGNPVVVSFNLDDNSRIKTFWFPENSVQTIGWLSIIRLRRSWVPPSGGKLITVENISCLKIDFWSFFIFIYSFYISKKCRSALQISASPLAPARQSLYHRSSSTLDSFDSCCCHALKAKLWAQVMISLSMTKRDKYFICWSPT